MRDYLDRRFTEELAKKGLSRHEIPEKTIEEVADVIALLLRDDDMSPGEQICHAGRDLGESL
jgi:hypothetical protein